MGIDTFIFYYRDLKLIFHWNLVAIRSHLLLKTIRTGLWGLMIISWEKLLPKLNKINLNSQSSQRARKKHWTNNKGAPNSYKQTPKFIMGLLESPNSKSNLHPTWEIQRCLRWLWNRESKAFSLFLHAELLLLQLPWI